MFTIESLTVTGQWVTADPFDGCYRTFPTLQAARQHATDAELATGTPCRAREVWSMRAPSDIYLSENALQRGIGYKATGEFRPPRKGEYYLSGAIIIAYLAPNDLSTPYWIAVPGTVRQTVTWAPLPKGH